MVRGHGLSRGNRDDAGFGLVTALALVLMLSTVAVVATGAVRAHIRSATQFGANMHARIAAESAIAAVVLDLHRNASRAFANSGVIAATQPVRCTLTGQDEVVLTVRDIAGRVDLNTASPSLLHSLFAGTGLDSDLAQSITEAILLRRTSMATTRALEPPRIDPPLQPFTAEEALSQIPGVSQRLAAQLMPYVTVHSGLAAVDTESADPSLAAILDSADAADVVGVRRGVRTRQTYVVTATARSGSGGNFALEVVLRIVRDPRFPVGAEVLSWRHTREPVLESALLSPDSPSCLTDGLFSGG